MPALHLIVAPPPTPNGDLHVGHMSGPYLAADIYRRQVLQEGHEAIYTVSTDDHQSYVDTTARRLGTDSESLIRQARRDIQHSLDAFNIKLDHFGQPNPDYNAFIKEFFTKLAAKNLIRVARVPVLFDTQTNTYPVEAFVSGCCPNCLEGTCGGICEGCGHPNACVDLVGLDEQRYESRQEERLILDLEQFRPALDNYLSSLGTHRPALQRLIHSLLSRKLTPLVISYKTPRGIETDGFGINGQRLNVWAEMYPGHMYWLTKMVGNRVADAKYVQFMGFDNSYFYVLAHVALAMAARQCGYEWPLPSAFITNQFYYLNVGKFSTSKGHAVWAKDLAAEYNTDLARLFLAWHGPEFQEGTFSEPFFRLAITDFAGKINKLAQAYNARRATGDRGGETLPRKLIELMSRGLSLSEYSNAELARRSIHCLEYLEFLLSSGKDVPLGAIPSAIALCLGPFCPAYVDEIKSRFNIRENSWANLAHSRSDASMPEIQEQYVRAHAL
jgi:methionyl-tRNA synthetase